MKIFCRPRARFFSVCAVVFATAAAVSALEIPVSPASTAAGSKPMKVAYVDMEVVYNNCPQKGRAAKEYKTLKDAYETKISSLTAALDARRGEAEKLGREIDEIKQASSALPADSIDVSTPADISPAAVSTAAAAGVQAVYEKEIARKSVATDVERLAAELEKTRKEMSSETAAMEKECAGKVLEEIYKALDRMAREEELVLIIDKNYILYAPETYDITHRVLERLK